MAQSGAPTVGSYKLAFAASIGTVVLIIAMLTFGSDDDPKPTDCLPQTATSGATVHGPGSKVFPLAKGSYQLSSPFGPRGGTMHQGQDLAAPLGTPIYAAMGGTVAAAGTANGFGHWIIIDVDSGGTKNSNVYGHMPGASLAVKTGQQVSAGQKIAVVGSEGESSGPHLHFEVWTGGTRLQGGHAVDPMPWLSGAGEPAGATQNPATQTATPRGPPAAAENVAATTPAASAPAGPAAAPADPSVVSVADWTKIAKLESGGNWAINTGNGYQGGLQFSPSTWTGNGGSEFAASADKASAAQQMEVANRVLKSQGWGAWPVTSKGAGVTAKKPAPAGTFLRGVTGQVATPAAAATPADPGAGCVSPGVGTQLKPGSVPPAFEPWIIKAATTCPEVTAPLIAAQIDNESHFNVNAHNTDSQADGPTQFVPETWAAKAVDGDGDGRKDTRSIADAVMSQAAYDCELAKIARDDVAKGALKGDLTELWLSMYNCGPGKTQAAGGVCGNPETQKYVYDIPTKARTTFSAAGTVVLPTGGGFGGRAVAAAMRWRGTPYAWGGGNQNGPTRGTTDNGGAADANGDFNKIGFDCSGLMIYAIAQASNHKIILGHYTTNQLNDPHGKPVPNAYLKPGDVLFPAGSDPQHVVMYIGHGQMIEAPQSGDVVKVSPVSNLGPGFSARRFG